MVSKDDLIKELVKKMMSLYGSSYDHCFKLKGERPEHKAHLDAMREAIGRYDEKDLKELTRLITGGHLPKYLDRPPKIPAMINIIDDIHRKFAHHKGIKDSINQDDAFTDAQAKNHKALTASNYAGDLDYSNKIIAAMNNNDVKRLHGDNCYEVMHQKHPDKKIDLARVKQLVKDQVMRRNNDKTHTRQSPIFR